MCHLRGALAPGKYTCVEKVCFVRPFGFEGRSCRRLVRGGTEFGSRARRALQTSMVRLERRQKKRRKYVPPRSFKIAFLLGRLKLLLVKQIIATHSTLRPRVNVQSNAWEIARAGTFQRRPSVQRSKPPLNSASSHTTTFPEHSCSRSVEDNRLVIRGRMLTRTASRMTCASRASRMSAKG